jgi:hypothetical protein
MRFSRTARARASTLDALSDGLQKYYEVPQNMPDEFLKAFARLDASAEAHTRREAERRSTSRQHHRSKSRFFAFRHALMRPLA